MEKQKVTGESTSSNDVEKSSEDKAATKAQAAFRGYLAQFHHRRVKLTDSRFKVIVTKFLCF
ncbi:hypothetical protein QJS10_CPB14g01285 [Acorus calamus]|uniref:Uncharacterized protein n=1 Tax=Acorus calamus TaxID=4465 RepID=A0AAV9DAW1_ACOCL|nr:hypothetical protein QJS10_CPB14g01285 [Acorus calamus]